jgi:CBS-domain-containing membrane protein
MESTDQAAHPSTGDPSPREAGGDASADLSEILAEIERLVDLDPADAAEPAARLADVLGAALEAAEEEH